MLSPFLGNLKEYKPSDARDGGDKRCTNKTPSIQAGMYSQNRTAIWLKKAASQFGSILIRHL